MFAGRFRGGCKGEHSGRRARQEILAERLQELPQRYIEMEPSIETLRLSFDNIFSRLLHSFPYLRLRLELRWTEDGYSTQCIIQENALFDEVNLRLEAAIYRSLDE